MPKVFVDVRQDLGYVEGWPSQNVWPIFKVKRVLERAYPPFQRFSCAIANHFLGDSNSKVKNAKKNCEHPSRPCLCSRLSLTANTIHFQGQTSPEARIPTISTIFLCYSTPFFRRSGFRRQKRQKFLWTSVKTLAMQSVVPHGQFDLFSRSNKSQSTHTLYFDGFRVL